METVPPAARKPGWQATVVLALGSLSFVLLFPSHAAESRTGFRRQQIRELPQSVEIALALGDELSKPVTAALFVAAMVVLGLLLDRRLPSALLRILLAVGVIGGIAGASFGTIEFAKSRTAAAR